MSFKITVDVKADAITTLRTAYKVMLSLGTSIEDCGEPIIDENLLFARATMKVKVIQLKTTHTTILKVKPVSTESSKLTCFVTTGTYDGGYLQQNMYYVSNLLNGISKEIYSTENDNPN